MTNNMHSHTKISKLAGSFLALLFLFQCSFSFAQDFSDYAGTYKGKLIFFLDEKYNMTSKVNELTFIISTSGDMTISYNFNNNWIYLKPRYKGEGDTYEYGKGTLTGKLNDDLSFSITGKTSYGFFMHEQSNVNLRLSLIHI